MKKRLLSLALVLCVVLTLLPVSAFADDNLLVQSGADIYLECGTATQKLFYITGFGYDGSNIQFRCSTTDNPPIKLLPASENYRSFGYNYIYGNFYIIGLHPGNCVIEAYNVITGENVAIFFVHVTEQTIKINSCDGNEMSFSCYSFNSNANLDIGYSQNGVYHGTGLNVVSKTIDSGWIDQSDPNNREKDVYRYRYDCKLTIYSTGDFNGYVYDTNDSSSVITKISFTINAHRFDNVERIVAPTCTQQGYTVFRCSACDAVGYSNYTSALGHNYSNWILTTTPTCTMSGEETRYCSRCDAYETRTVDALSHNYTAVVTAPTCTEKGYTTHTCTICGDSYVDSYVDALGHDFGEWKVTTAPTCTEKGVETHSCSRCDVTETRDIAVIDHDTELINEKAASCTEDGYTGDEVCKICNKTIKSGEVIPALGHEYKDGKCVRCGEVNNPFTDIGGLKQEMQDAILWAYYHEPEQITSGFTATEFRPNNDCTRGQVVTFLWRAAGCPEPTGNINVFKDASSIASPYQKAVAWAVEKGITTGFADGTFRPNDSVTRAQFVTFLWRYEGKPATSGSIAGFTDAASIASPYQQAVAWAVEKGITTGYNDGTFRPNATCTRWAVVLFMYRDMK